MRMEILEIPSPHECGTLEPCIHKPEKKFNKDTQSFDYAFSGYPLVHKGTTIEHRGSDKETIVDRFQSPDLGLSFRLETYPDTFLSRGYPRTWKEFESFTNSLSKIPPVSARVRASFTNLLRINDLSELPEAIAEYRKVLEEENGAEALRQLGLLTQQITENTRHAGKAPIWFIATPGRKAGFFDEKSGEWIDEATFTPKNVDVKACLKCKRRLGRDGRCPVCDPFVALTSRVVEDTKKKQTKRKIPGTGILDPENIVLPPELVGSRAVVEEKELIKVIKWYRKLLLPVILEGKDPEDYEDFGRIDEEGGTAELTIFLSRGWQYPGVAEAIVEGKIPATREALTLHDAMMGGWSSAEYGKSLIDYVNTTERGTDEERAEMPRMSALLSGGAKKGEPARRIPGLPSKVPTSQVTWSGVPQLKFRVVDCPHCGYVNVDTGETRDDGKTPLPLKCELCKKSFRIEDLPRRVTAMSGRGREEFVVKPGVGPWQIAHGGAGPKKAPLQGKKLAEELREAKYEERTRSGISTTGMAKPLTKKEKRDLREEKRKARIDEERKKK